MMRLGPHREILGFAIVGGTGFLVDAVILTLLSHHMSVYLARLFSFAVALTVTWLLNRSFVFAGADRSARGRIAEYSRYFVVQGVGAAVNFAAFSLLIFMFCELKSWPVIPLAFGSGLGMFVNYFGVRTWVFAPRS